MGFRSAIKAVLGSHHNKGAGQTTSGAERGGAGTMRPKETGKPAASGQGVALSPEEQEERRRLALEAYERREQEQQRRGNISDQTLKMMARRDQASKQGKLGGNTDDFKSMLT